MFFEFGARLLQYFCRGVVQKRKTKNGTTACATHATEWRSPIVISGFGIGTIGEYRESEYRTAILPGLQSRGMGHVHVLFGIRREWKYPQLAHAQPPLQ